jgi:hypothetical protein
MKYTGEVRLIKREDRMREAMSSPTDRVKRIRGMNAGKATRYSRVLGKRVPISPHRDGKTITPPLSAIEEAFSNTNISIA